MHGLAASFPFLSPQSYSLESLPQINHLHISPYLGKNLDLRMSLLLFLHLPDKQLFQTQEKVMPDPSTKPPRPLIYSLFWISPMGFHLVPPGVFRELRRSE